MGNPESTSRPLPWLLLLVATLAGCAEQSHMVTMQALTLRARPPALLSHDGLDLAVLAITPQNLRAHNELRAHVTYLVRDARAPMSGGFAAPNRRPPTAKRTVNLTLSPLPVFQVRIANHTGKLIDFTRAQLSLSSASGKVFPALLDLGAIEGRVERDLSGTAIAMENPRLRDVVRDAITKLPFITRDTAIANGETWRGYLVFDTNTHDDGEVEALLGTSERFDLALAGLVDGGGYAFAFDRVTAPLAVRCPAGVEPTLTQCRIVDNALTASSQVTDGDRVTQ